MSDIDSPYYVELKDGKAWLGEIEPTVIGTLNFDYGAPQVGVDRLEMDGVDLLQSPTPLVQELAKFLKDKIEQETDWAADRAEELGYRYKGLGGTDPSARWVTV